MKRRRLPLLIASLLAIAGVASGAAWWVLGAGAGEPSQAELDGLVNDVDAMRGFLNSLSAGDWRIQTANEVVVPWRPPGGSFLSCPSAVTWEIVFINTSAGDGDGTIGGRRPEFDEFVTFAVRQTGGLDIGRSGSEQQVEVVLPNSEGILTMSEKVSANDLGSGLPMSGIELTTFICTPGEMQPGSEHVDGDWNLRYGDPLDIET